MLIGIRFLVMFAVIAISASFLAYLFTKNARILQFTKMLIKITVSVIVVVLIIFVLERVLF
jgi:Na+-driven multidrug efflux pump